MLLKRIKLFSALIFIASSGNAENYLDEVNHRPSINSMTICHGYTCKHLDEISLDEKEWRSAIEPFENEALTAEQERGKIRQAIAIFERIVGYKTGTSDDLAKNWDGLGQKGQLDCVDESINTTTYLKLLQSNEILKWHEVMSTSSRGLLIFKWPHSTAVIREILTHDEYAVDSWYMDNGEEPYILPLAEWKKGWEPQE